MISHAFYKIIRNNIDEFFFFKTKYMIIRARSCLVFAIPLPETSKVTSN